MSEILEGTVERSDRKAIVRRRVIGTPFKKGNSGRPKGILDKRTLQQREVLQLFAEGFTEKSKPDGCEGPLAPRVERLRRLLDSDDESIRAETEKFLAGYEWARPKVTLEIEGSIDISALILAAFSRARNGNGNGAGSPR